MESKVKEVKFTRTWCIFGRIQQIAEATLSSNRVRTKHWRKCPNPSIQNSTSKYREIKINIKIPLNHKTLFDPELIKIIKINIHAQSFEIYIENNKG